MASLEQVAKHLEMSQVAVSKLIREGVIDRQERGQYDVDDVRAQYIRHIRAVASGRAASGDLDLGAERARLAKEQADAKEMENAVERGELVYISDVSKQFQLQLTKVRTKLLAIPTKVAAEVHASATIKEAKQIIEENIEDALRELVGYSQEGPTDETEI